MSSAASGPSSQSIHGWLAEGFLAGEQDTTGGPWRVRLDAAMRDRIVSDRPELDAVHVNRGRRVGLAIRIPGGPCQLRTN